MQLVRRDLPASEAGGTEKRTFSVGRTPIGADPEWFYADDPGPGMVAMGQAIAQAQGWRRSQNLRLARLYQDRDVSSVYANAGSAAAMITEIMGPQRASWNLVRAACDVAHSRVGKNRGRVMFVSVDGNWSMRRKARLRTRFIDGAFRMANVYEEMSRVFLDGAVFGIGLLYVYSEDGKLKSERVLPDEVVVDPGEGIHANPRTIYRRKPMPRSQALRLAGDDPKKQAAVRGAPVSFASIGIERVFANGDLVDVWTAWRLPSSPKAKDGRYVVAVEGCTIDEGPWNRPRHPIVAFRWGDALAGWYGLGIAEQLVGHQLAIRKIQWQIASAIYHGATFKILAHTTSKVNPKQFNNDPRGTVITYSGEKPPPQFIAPSVVQPELFSERDREWQHGFDQVGLPPTGSGTIPPNLKSGEAIRAYTESVDSRLAVPSQRWDASYVNVAEVLLDETREIGSLAVESKVRRSYKRINWKDVADGDDDMVLQPWPSSILPATPSGRYDRLQELEQAGWISKEQAMAVLDVPDLESVIGLETSTYELIGMHLENMLDEGTAEQPEPYQGLDLSLRIMQSAVIKAKVDGCPDDRLQLVRDYIDAIRDLQKQAASENASSAPPPQAQPGAPGTPDQQGQAAQGAPAQQQQGVPPMAA
jgi:hypothetical protein